MTKYFEMASKSNLRWKSLTKKFWQNRIHTYFKIKKFQNENTKCRIVQNMTENFWKILPQSLEQNFSNSFAQIVGNAMTSNFHSEISWPLAEIENHSV